MAFLACQDTLNRRRQEEGELSDYNSLKKLITEEGIDFIDFKIVDLVGRLRHITIPAQRFTPSLVETGVAFDGSNFGYTRVAESDMVLVPDLATATVDRYKGEKILSIIADIRLAGGGGPFRADPRSIARRAERYLASAGIAETVMVSPEFEFYVFREAHYGCKTIESHYSISPLNEHVDFSYYHICPPEDQLFVLRNEICRRLEKQGIPVKYHHHEVGPLGQVEIELGFAGLLAMADATLVVKSTVRNVVEEAGLTATFMPKPVYGQNGNGMHVHQYLARDGESLFADVDGLSELAYAYIGGILSHGRSLMALTNPSTNSYRRFVSGYEAPVCFSFGEGNRSAAIRIPGYAMPSQKRIELRTIDATCNPYLAYAAMLMAGIDGIKHNLNAIELGFGPQDRDMFAVSRDEASPIPRRPLNLGEALRALEEDHDYLIAGGVFEEGQIARWIRCKKEEQEQVNNRPHPHEYSLYYNL